MRDAGSYVRKAFETGASGCVTKASGGRQLVWAAATVLTGKWALSPPMAEALAQEHVVGTPPLAEPDPREVEILCLLVQGWLDTTIAEALNLSRKTLRDYHYGIKEKTGADNDAHLVSLAIPAKQIGSLGEATDGSDCPVITHALARDGFR